MDKVYQYIIENASTGQLDIHMAAKLIAMIKSNVKAADDIAIIGVAGQFPKSADVVQFWSHLSEGRDCITTIPEQRKQDLDSVFSIQYGQKQETHYLQLGYLDNIDQFDPSFFHILPAEAEFMDPEQRLFLETAWHALEDAGYTSEEIKGTRTGVYAGQSSDFGESYKNLIRQAAPQSEAQGTVGNIKSITATRLSYLLNLNGPGMVVDTACSSALVALHLACEAVQTGECDMAVAGGVNVCLTPIDRKGVGEIGTSSSSQKSKTFDDSADGIGLGEGVAAVVIKPLQKAISAHDHIYAVIKGTAVNQDGSSNGITAPNGKSQEELLVKAWEKAKIDPETISYLEVHGTGTKLGDPIEIAGISSAFRKFTDKKQFCAVSALKTQIGHLDNASGIAAVVKAVLALQYHRIPPTIHFEKPNEKIDFIQSPVYVNDRLIEWKSDGTARRCGISSFGLSGTNCHVVLEEYRDEEERKPETQQPFLFMLSAKTKKGLVALLKKYRIFLEEHETVQIGDLCYTAAVGRIHQEYRLAFLVSDGKEMQKKLKFTLQYLGEQRKQPDFLSYGTFILTAGKKYGAEQLLTKAEKKQLDRKAERVIEECLTQHLITLPQALEQLADLYTSGADIASEKLYKEQQCKRISLPGYPFEKERYWVKPVVPERKPEPGFGAALVKGKVIDCWDRTVFQTEFSVKEDWVLREHKVRGVYTLPGTAFLEMVGEICRKAYGFPAVELKQVWFHNTLSVSENENRTVEIIMVPEPGTEGTYKFTVVSQGKPEQKWIRHVEGNVQKIAVENELSYDIEELRQSCMAGARTIETDRKNHTIETGNRWDVVDELFYSENHIFTQLTLKNEYWEDLKQFLYHPVLLDVGVNVPINVLHGGYLPFSYQDLKLYRELPAQIYSYIELQNQTIENEEVIQYNVKLLNQTGQICAEVTDYMLKQIPEPNVSDKLFYRTQWVEAELPEEKTISNENVMVISDQSGLADSLVSELEKNGNQVLVFRHGQEAGKLEQRYVSEFEEDYQTLAKLVKSQSVSRIFFLSLQDEKQKIDEYNKLKKHFQNTAQVVLYLFRALANSNLRSRVNVYVICNNANEVTGKETHLYPMHAIYGGICKVVSQEYQNVQCKVMDVDDTVTEKQVLRETVFEKNVSQTAYRDGKKYIQQIVKDELSRYEELTKPPVREGGVYVITGGLGGIGLAISSYLAQVKDVTLCLLSRSGLDWKDCKEETRKKRSFEKREKAVQSIRNQGARVVIYQCDVGNQEELRSVLADIRKQFGGIHGVIHGAGVSGDGLLIDKTYEQLKEVYVPKVYGTWLMDYETREDHLDFFLTHSSLSSLVGGIGLCAYASANAYLNAFAAYRNRFQTGSVNINWTAWKDTGMKYDLNRDEDVYIFKSIYAKEAIPALEQVLRRKIAGILIGEIDIPEMVKVLDVLPIKMEDNLAEYLREEAASLEQQRIKNFSEMKDKFIRSELEKQLSEIWGRALGIEEVNMYESFNDLGGDSIQAGVLLKEIEQYFPNMVSISDIFAYPTIYDMASHIEDLLKKIEDEDNVEEFTTEDTDESELDMLLEQVEKGEISVDDIDW